MLAAHHRRGPCAILTGLSLLRRYPKARRGILKGAPVREKGSGDAAEAAWRRDEEAMACRAVMGARCTGG